MIRNVLVFLQLLVFMMLMLGGCASLPDEIERPVSVAFEDTSDTQLAQVFDPVARQHPDLSGFAVLNDGREAFVARAGLASFAERSIDAQYYLWNNDRTGNYLLRTLVEASQRGVRVRLLIDDTYAVSKSFEIAVLDNLPNMQVRLFNPYAQRKKYAVFRRGINFLTDISRLNHRMHNKVFVVDNKVAIVGGRNIGDEYFGISESYNFRDMDLISAGPIVADVSAGFDQYWNSNWAYPAAALNRTTISTAKTDKLLTKLTDETDQYRGLKKVLPADRQDYLGAIHKLRDELIWADAELVSDSPEKAQLSDSDAPSQVLLRLGKVMSGASEEILAESAYFVPGQRGAQALVDAVERGVTVKVLSNSLASTNHSVAHTGYKPYRKRLLRGGVQLFEVQPRAASRSDFTVDPHGDHNFGLHTKAIVFDRSSVFVGTLNLDPRSVNLNTEMGLLVHNRLLAQKIAELMEKDMAPPNSFKVYLQDKRLRWQGEVDGETKTFKSEPQAGFGRRLAVFFGSLFPIEKQL